MRADRRSAYAQWDMSERSALIAEARGGLAAVEQEAIAGAQRFAAGAGRHGAAVDDSGDEPADE